MDYASTLQQFKSIEDFRKLKIDRLKAILREHNLPISGKKEDLALRCYVIVERDQKKDDLNTSISKENQQPLKSDCTYEQIIRDATGCIWKKDLRELPMFTFVQLYDYLVLKTSKYNNAALTSCGYKKLKAFQFFKEGHIKDLQLCFKGDLIYVKAEVLASMKSEKYKSVVVFDRRTSNIVKAACKCPAGRGENGLGRCNHVGGVIFAIEDFARSGLSKHNQPISCTSRLCNWNVPRNMRVDPKPVDRILLKKIIYGKKRPSSPKITSYDPRAPSDRSINVEALHKLGEHLSTCLASSSFFLFHDIESKVVPNCKDVEIESICETVPECAEVSAESSEQKPVPFNDSYDINSKQFKEMIDLHVSAQTITDEEVSDLESLTRGQSENEEWHNLERIKLTASNFKSAAIRVKEPDALLKRIMYLENDSTTIPSLEYGRTHEQEAVDCYIAYKCMAGNNGLRVWEVGTMISKQRPGFGASLDRMVYDPLASTKKGGLEVKCPYAKRGMTVDEACQDDKFYLTIHDSQPGLNKGHAYYYQVQGQMFVCELDWVDFVVWFGNNVLFVERISFDRDWWLKEALPALDYFYTSAFYPEVLTRRVERGVSLYLHGGWSSYRKLKKPDRGL